MAAIAKLSPSEDSKPVTVERKTKGGRTLQYRLTVLQQPERARACGSGSKCEFDPPSRDIPGDAPG